MFNDFGSYSLPSVCKASASLIGEVVVHDVEATLLIVIDVVIRADY